MRNQRYRNDGPVMQELDRGDGSDQEMRRQDALGERVDHRGLEACNRRDHLRVGHRDGLHFDTWPAAFTYEERQHRLAGDPRRRHCRGEASVPRDRVGVRATSERDQRPDYQCPQGLVS